MEAAMEIVVIACCNKYSNKICNETSNEICNGICNKTSNESCNGICNETNKKTSITTIILKQLMKQIMG